MRTIQIDEPESDHTWLWLTAGAALGLVAGVLLADRIKGRRGSLRSIVSRGRRFATTAIDTLGPLLESIRDRGEDAEREDDGPDDDEDEDGGIGERVLEAFIHDPVLAERLVEIDERRPGVIVLHGRVRSEREAKHAMTIARGVPGVERVRSRLTIRERSR